MKRLIVGLAAAAVLAVPAFAAIPVGSKAPVFSAPAYLAGNQFNFSLAEALKKGPVVLYFFPSAHTAGCNIEAHMFADSIDKFKAQGATVIGVTSGKLSELAAFSAETEHCSGKFPVAADPDATIAKTYDSTLSIPGMHLSNRTSFVIAPGGDVIFEYSAMAPEQHISQTLDAVSKWRAAHPRG